MQKLFSFVCVVVLFASCKKETVTMMTVSEPFSEVAYTVTFTGKWSEPAFGVPSGVHFTSLAGAIHNNDVLLWSENSYATRSLQYVAENGFAAPLLKDVDTLVDKKKALTSVNVAAPPPVGSRSFTVTANSNYSVLSFATMLAPSPDWFAGVSSLDLYNKGRWVKDTTVLVYAYDAGTKEGDAFSYTFPATLPQKTIKRLTPLTASVLAAGGVSLAPIAELRLVKQ